MTIVILPMRMVEDLIMLLIVGASPRLADAACKDKTGCHEGENKSFVLHHTHSCSSGMAERHDNKGQTPRVESGSLCIENKPLLAFHRSFDFITGTANETQLALWQQETGAQVANSKNVQDDV
ncbi:hypothetical protein [Oryzifoliimicrobium ureilyticus]|uniref:hypothetical protein n=1 Tax=Oryzifoliimicrobium ureilyticus TaxID=3113724 RepID=UPI0030766B5C